MRIKKASFASFTAINVDRRTPRSKFFNEIDLIIDWVKVDKIRNTYYSKSFSAVEQDAYSGWLLYKMLLVGTWYGLSDYEVKDRVNDSISFSYFCGLNIDQVAPDHSTLSRFRSMMTKVKAYQPLFKEINRQLKAHNIIVKTGAIVDASVIDTPLKPKW